MIAQMPSHETIRYEQSILTREYEDARYYERLTRDITRRIASISSDIPPKGVSQRDLQTYHARYYHRDNHIVVNDDYILLTLDHIPAPAYVGTDTSTRIERVISIESFEGTSYVCLVDVYDSWRDYYRLYFLHTLFESHQEWRSRYYDGEYFDESLVLSYSLYPQTILVLSRERDYSISMDFFESCRSYFIDSLMHGEARKGRIIHFARFGELIDPQEIISSIETISYTYLQDLITDIQKISPS